MCFNSFVFIVPLWMIALACKYSANVRKTRLIILRRNVARACRRPARPPRRDRWDRHPCGTVWPTPGGTAWPAPQRDGLADTPRSAANHPLKFAGFLGKSRKSANFGTRFAAPSACRTPCTRPSRIDPRPQDPSSAPARTGTPTYLPLPVAMPAMNCFWNTMYTMITGMIASEVAANRPP